MSTKNEPRPSDQLYEWTAAAVYRIQNEKPAVSKADLAKLRKGLGKTLESSPELWGMILASFPEELFSKELFSKQRGAGAAENAAFHALTLYGMIQQGHDPKSDSYHRPGISLGKAAAEYTVATCKPEDEDASHILPRFQRLIVSESMKDAQVPLRSLLQLLAQKEIGLDIAMLAKDLYEYDYPPFRDSVRMKWARDYYRRIRELRDLQSKKNSKDKEEGESK